MADTFLAAVKVGASATEIHELPLPSLPADAALLKMEVGGVCGTDVSQYKLPLRGSPLIIDRKSVV